MKKCEMILNIFFAAVTSAYVFMFTFYTTRACLNNPDLNLINLVGTTMFFILGSTFFAVGLVMNFSLKWHFPNFYN
jgi:hypothetical protein